MPIYNTYMKKINVFFNDDSNFKFYHPFFAAVITYCEFKLRKYTDDDEGRQVLVDALQA